MPFIRYDIRDRAAILDIDVACDCGFSGQSMRLIEGRDEDFFCLPDGCHASPRKVYAAVAGVLPFKALGNELFQAICGFQIIQEMPNLMTVNVIAGPKYRADVWRGVEESAKALHPDMRVRVNVVEELERTPGGKLKVVMSRVDSSAEAALGWGVCP